LIRFDLLKIGNPPRVTIAEDVRVDLELDKITSIASNGDKLIAETWLDVLLLQESSEDDIRYRQEAVKDALAHRDVVLKMYSIAREALERVRRETFIFRLDDPVIVVYEASKGVRIFVDALEKLLAILRSTPSFTSEAFNGLVSSLTTNIDERFISFTRRISEIFSFDEGVDFLVEVGDYNYLKNPVLLVPKKKESLLSKILAFEKGYRYKLDPRDEAGVQILYDIEKWALSQTATTLMKAHNKMKRFFEDLMRQLSFYVGAINMSVFFERLELPKAYPEFNRTTFSFKNLYCLSLAISKLGKPIPYTLDVKVDGAFAVLITGANKGGKTTFLKSVGQSLLLARAGLFVPAENFTIPSPRAVYTHFLRGEERVMSYGKFEEEVRRFKNIVNSVKKNDFILMDESFSSTNPVEASVVAENVVSALLDSGVNVFYVTFLQDLIHNLIKRYKEKIVLLVPERLEDGTRTFRLIRGTIQPGYAIDLWNRISKSLTPHPHNNTT